MRLTREHSNLNLRTGLPRFLFPLVKTLSGSVPRPAGRLRSLPPVLLDAAPASHWFDKPRSLDGPVGFRWSTSRQRQMPDRVESALCGSVGLATAGRACVCSIITQEPLSTTATERAQCGPCGSLRQMESGGPGGDSHPSSKSRFPQTLTCLANRAVTRLHHPHFRVVDTSTKPASTEGPG